MPGKKLTDYVVDAIIGLIVTLFVLFGTGAWSTKESVLDHQRDMSAVFEIQTRTLDILCDSPTNRVKRACVDPKPKLDR